MIGAIIGDIAGAPYEMDKLGQDRRDYQPFYLNGLAKFTDDTNLTIAVADALLTGATFESKILEWYKRNPDLGYGSAFREWGAKGGGYKNESRGNGAAMRVSPVALFALQQTEEDVHGDPIPLDRAQQWAWALKTACATTEPTHNCDEARNGAMAVVSACLMGAWKKPKEEIKETLESLAKYDLSPTVETVRNEWSKRDIRCDITVPQALICFLESTSFEDAVRLGVYSKGDTDTIAAIAGSIAEWYYGVDSISPEILAETKRRLQPEMIAIIDKAYQGKLKW